VSIDERAIWHESGHSVVALNLGFAPADIMFKNGNLEATHARFPEMLLHHYCLVQAAGAASEKLKFGGYNPEGSSADAARIAELGVATIEDYLQEAVGILEAHWRELELIAEELGNKYAQSLLNGRPSLLRLMSAGEVDAVHKAAATT
jgi:hypothetical protein